MPLGIPHSTFLEWPEHDREYALAYLREKLKECSGCGTRREEWDEKRGGDRFAYVADSYLCPGCEVLEMERENIPDRARGVHVKLLPKRVAELLEEQEEQ